MKTKTAKQRAIDRTSLAFMGDPFTCCYLSVEASFDADLRCSPGKRQINGSLHGCQLMVDSQRVTVYHLSWLCPPEAERIDFFMAFQYPPDDHIPRVVRRGSMPLP